MHVNNNLQQVSLGFASVFTSLFSHVPVEFSQKEIILYTVWALASCLQEAIQQMSGKRKVENCIISYHANGRFYKFNIVEYHRLKLAKKKNSFYLCSASCCWP